MLCHLHVDYQAWLTVKAIGEEEQQKARAIKG